MGFLELRAAILRMESRLAPWRSQSAPVSTRLIHGSSSGGSLHRVHRVACGSPGWGWGSGAAPLAPMTLLTGVATLHGNNLMDTPYDVPAPLLSWLDIATMPTDSSFPQASAGVYRAGTWDDWTAHPDVTDHTYNGAESWIRLDPGSEPVDVTGRLVGGCIETLCNLAGTPFADVGRFARKYAPEGLIVYVEAAGDDAATICRNLHGMRLAGFFSTARRFSWAARPPTTTLT